MVSSGMTKKQVLFSLRERVNHAREIAERDKSHEKQFSDSYEYYSGRIDSYDFVLEMLSDYE